MERQRVKSLLKEEQVRLGVAIALCCGGIEGIEEIKAASDVPATDILCREPAPDTCRPQHGYIPFSLVQDKPFPTVKEAVDDFILGFQALMRREGPKIKTLVWRVRPELCSRISFETFAPEFYIYARGYYLPKEVV